MPRCERHNAGAAWTVAEEDRLRVGFCAGFSLENLCKDHGRTAAAVLTRLVRMGLLVVRNKEYRRLDPNPFATFEEAHKLEANDDEQTQAA